MTMPIQSLTDDSESKSRKRNVLCSRRLLKALRFNHAPCDDIEPEPSEPEPAKTLTPIPNDLIAAACAVAWGEHPPLIPGPIRKIQIAVLKEFPNITMTDLFARRRTRAVTHPRQIAMYLSKVLTGNSLPEIGRRFGGRDHTTVLHAVRKIERDIQAKPDLAAQVVRLRAAIGEVAL